MLPGVKLVIYAKETPAKLLIRGHGWQWDFTEQLFTDQPYKHTDTSDSGVCIYFIAL